jgi:DNA (cytosine-5)-methyltransferase 1
MRRKQPTVGELFAGAGVFGAAFVAEGFSPTFAIEADPIPAATYRRNVHHAIAVADINDVTPERKCDVLIAGPPCQGFSTLNQSRSDDSRKILALKVADWAKVCKPKVIVIENVAPFLQSPIWNKLARRLSKLGYHVTGRLIEAANIGVPQFRSRSFTIASQVAIDVPELLQAKPRSVADAWAGLSNEPDGENHHIAPFPSDIALERMRVIPPGGGKRDLIRLRPDLTPKSWKNVPYEAADVWGRMRWDSPSNTIRTCCQNASKGRYIHPDQHRVISLREAARLQTIPDDWQFTGLPTQVARQIGNAVPLLLGRYIASIVRRAI